ncbi:MAG: GHKL domain-containing protein [Silvanigrellaceae bacterium]|nr:GHKL domain-containing protein [Silvanigrellaceae bacterium]
MAKQEIEFIEDLKRQWLSMIDAIDDPLVLLNDDYTIIRQNHSYFEKIKTNNTQNIKEINGKKCYEVFAMRSTPCPHCQLNTLATGKETIKWETESLLPSKNIQISVKKILSSDNKYSYVVHYKDITEVKSMYQQLNQAEKLASIGKLAGGFAHEINTPLAAILAFTQILMSEIESTSVFFNDLEQIEIAARKCKEIVEDLLKVARVGVQNSNLVPLELCSQIKSILRLANGLLSQSQVTLTTHFTEQSKIFILGDTNKIGQVFLNLLTNAIHAMPNGGNINIDLREEDDFVYIDFEDTGKGIPPDIIHKIFDPFFTTKTVGKGTGLGLSIVYSIIKEHRGEIQVSSQLDFGTKFSICLPLCKATL